MSKLKKERIILTGATGGIGGEIARLLLAEGAQVGLVGRSQEKLQHLQAKLGSGSTTAIAADITTSDGRQKIVDQMRDAYGGYDILINTAGIMDFTAFVNQSDERIEAVFQTNVIAPMQLTKKVLPYMLKQNKGHIVNVGSTFGSIGFAWFTTYSTSKFAMRGFSQALRRELCDTAVKVTYVAPRAVKTALNSTAVYKMAEEVKMNMDAPKDVAREIVRSVIKQDKERYLGFPESLFVRINAIFPGLVDKATRGQNKVAKKHIS